MEGFVKGDVIVLPFPFTDLSSAKRRPAVVLSAIGSSLRMDSNVRPNKIFTLNKQLILYKVGHLSEEKINECVSKVCEIIRNG